VDVPLTFSLVRAEKQNNSHQQASTEHGLLLLSTGLGSEMGHGKLHAKTTLYLLCLLLSLYQFCPSPRCSVYILQTLHVPRILSVQFLYARSPIPFYTLLNFLVSLSVLFCVCSYFLHTLRYLQLTQDAHRRRRSAPRFSPLVCCCFFLPCFYPLPFIASALSTELI
jgi:hypothetical protein